MNIDSFGSKTTLSVGGKPFTYYRLQSLIDGGLSNVARLPFSLKILLENLLRYEDGRGVTNADITTLASWRPNSGLDNEISFTPARVLLQDFTGVPVVVDLASMREAITKLGGDPKRSTRSSRSTSSSTTPSRSTPSAATSPSRRTSSSSSSATASATSSCAGARVRSTTSWSSRPAPASSTR